MGGKRIPHELLDGPEGFVLGGLAAAPRPRRQSLDLRQKKRQPRNTPGFERRGESGALEAKKDLIVFGVADEDLSLGL